VSRGKPTDCLSLSVDSACISGALPSLPPSTLKEGNRGAEDDLPSGTQTLLLRHHQVSLMSATSDRSQGKSRDDDNRRSRASSRAHVTRTWGRRYQAQSIGIPWEAGIKHCPASSRTANYLWSRSRGLYPTLAQVVVASLPAKGKPHNNYTKRVNTRERPLKALTSSGLDATQPHHQWQQRPVIARGVILHTIEMFSEPTHTPHGRRRWQFS
jgi:hypothetical protein